MDVEKQIAEYEEVRKKWGQIEAKAWKDPEFKQKLIDNPKAVLESEGLVVDQPIKVIEETQDMRYFVIREQPQGELGEECLKMLAAGISAAECSGATMSA